MSRGFILVIDSFGIGGAADAADFGDAGADTLGHIAAACARGEADQPRGRSGPLRLPNLVRLGLGEAARISTGRVPPGLESDGPAAAAFAAAGELSRGKDTPSGHWEMAGLPVLFDWGYFPRTVPCFPDDLVAALVERGRLPGILGNKHASGTEIIAELGEEHLRSGKPICYTSADSVLQIAAHETAFGLERLYALCEIAETLVRPLNVGRVIARPFVGDAAKTFRRTPNRRDYTMPPPGDTLLDRLAAAGRETISVGKIADIFAHRSISRRFKAADTDGLFDCVLQQARDAPDGSLVFVNFVDFDMQFGHRRNLPGYAAELERLDRRLPELEAALRPGDLAVISADHGCDPSWPGSDHTRENVPLLFFGPGVDPADLGLRASFADLGQTLAAHLGVAALDHGVDCLAGQRPQ